MILADIAQGNTSGADIFFLIAVILFAIAAITHFIGVPAAGNPPARPVVPWYSFFIAVGLACVAMGLLLL
jgi:hypothetical protein